MKPVLFLLSFLLIILSASAQDSTMGMNKTLTNKIKKHKQCLQRFVQKDTIDAVTGRKYSINQFFYFGKETGQLQLVHVVESQKNNGKEIYYSFYNNQLIKVEMTPSRNECKNCSKEYFFWNNHQVCKQDPCTPDPEATVYLQEAALLKAKVPDRFPSESLNKD